MLKWFREWRRCRHIRKQINNDEYWTPFHMGLTGELQHGDFLMCIKREQTLDYIAGIMGMDPHLEAGMRRLWKVDLSNESLIQMRQGKLLTYLKYWGWDEEDPEKNICTVPAAFLRDGFTLEVFYHKREAK